jgi:hypothetical protein
VEISRRGLRSRTWSKRNAIIRINAFGQIQGGVALNIRKRAVGLLAAAGLVGGTFAIAAPPANAVQLATCTNIQFFGTLTPPLPGNGDVTATVAALKTAKPSTVVYGPGFATSTTTSATGATCTFGIPTPTPVTFNDAQIGAKLSGVATCNPASTDPTQYPLNGKMKIAYNTKLLSEQIYLRVAGFDTVPGPDVIATVGIDVKGSMPGASVTGESFFDPVVKALVNGQGGGPELKNQYYFDNAQLSAACASSATGTSIGLIYGGSGISLLGSDSGPGLSFDI